jgi:MmyB-like transcription regulator ligand binding domain
VMGNGGSDRLLAALVEPELRVAHANHLRIVFHPRGARRFIVNWDEVARHLLRRAERELGGLGEDADAKALLDELHEYAGPLPRAGAPLAGDVLLPIHLKIAPTADQREAGRREDIELRLFSTIMTLGTPRDVTLQELRIETFFPADTASARVWAEHFAEP